MTRLTKRTTRLFVAISLSFSLLCSSLLSLTPRPTAGAQTAWAVNTAPSRLITEPHRAGELLVKFRTGAAAGREQVLAAFGQQQRPLRDGSGIVRLRLKAGAEVQKTLAELQRLSEVVEWAEPNYLVTRAEAPASKADKQHSKAQTAAAEIALPTAWRYTKGKPNTIVAVIDTGVDTEHPDLQQNLWRNQAEARGAAEQDDEGNGYPDDVLGWNFVNETKDVRDDNGHGTRVAGLIAGKGHNSTGVMQRASLLPLKALDASGEGDVAAVSEALAYAIAQRAAVINCSFGTHSYSRTLLEALNRAQEAGIVVVAAAGNDGQELAQAPFYPAGYETANLIAVAATMPGAQLAEFSNWDRSRVQLAAPGVGLPTTEKGGGYTQLSGTSAAAALVSGVAGLLKAERGWMAAQTIRQNLFKGARQVQGLSDKIKDGAMLNAAGALSVFKAGERPLLSPGARAAVGALKSAALQGGATNLDVLANTAPQPPVYTPTGSFPPAGYDDPKSINEANFHSYFTQATRPENNAGAVGGQPLEAPDPTASAAPVGGLSIDVLKRRSHFAAPILSLAGRAGLDLGLALHFSSKSLWLRDYATDTMAFNVDRGFPAPGWHLGFGKILGASPSSTAYINGVTNSWSYVYIAPDGTRHDLKANNTTGRYESYDSTYMYFTQGSQSIKMANGTEISFLATSFDPAAREYLFLPTKIRDRNGNFISIFYKTLGTPNKLVLDYVLDTAGRRIDFEYQDNRLTAIKQERGGAWFYYARFDYQPVTVSGHVPQFWGAFDPPTINSTQIWLPSRVTYPTGVNLRFSYHYSGQLNKIEKWVPTLAGQGAERRVAYTRLDLAFQGCADTCENSMMVANRYDFAENWQNGQEQRYQYNKSGAAGVVKDPYLNGFRAEITGLVKTLQTVAESQFSSGEFLKEERSTYEQDAGLNYPSNLRLSESFTTDKANQSITKIRKTTYSYSQQNGLWLPHIMDEYNADQSAVYRRTVTSYLHYPAQYLMALPQQVQVFAGPGATLLAQSFNNYDETGSYTDSNNQTAPYFINATGVIQHDDQNYGPSFTARGNLTSVRQDYIYAGQVYNPRISKRLSYDTNGNLRATADGLLNRQQIAYDDSYTNKPAGVGLTHAHVYTTTDPTGFRSAAIHDYFNGRLRWTYNMLPGSGTGHQWWQTAYDFADRAWITAYPTGTYVYNHYWDNWLASSQWQAMDAGQANQNFALHDGAGRVFRKANYHPSGPVGYAAQLTVYDKLGQVQDVSNVTTVDSAWNPTGDDTATGYYFTHLTRDELYRVKFITLPDGNSQSYEYTGCGCAGSSERRFTDEMGHTTTTKTDFLGRVYEVTAPESRTAYYYTELDQMYSLYHFDNGGQFQYRHFYYDGYGRQYGETTPEGGTTTKWFHNNDLVWYTQDARNVVAYYSYDKRNLLTNIIYSNSAAPPVTIGYDAWGARQTLTDGEGATSYVYNAQRQLQSETRSFTGLPGKSYTLNYTYNLASQVKSVNYSLSDGSFNKHVNYAYHSAGGVLASIGTNLIGADPNANSNVLNTTAYRAFGALKALNYGNGRRLTLNYEAMRQEPISMIVDRSDNPGDKIMDYEYEYYQNMGSQMSHEGRIRKLIDKLDAAYTTEFSYDHAERLTGATAPAYTRGYGFDAWGNLTSVTGSGGPSFQGYTLNYEAGQFGGPATNRILNVNGTLPYTYDAAGNLTAAEGRNYAYDGASRLTSVNSGTLGQYGYDGDGLRVKKVEGGVATYYVRSSVLGQALLEVTSAGVQRAYVYAPNGKLLAQRSTDGQFYWVHTDHLSSGRKLTDASGTVIYRAEFDPHGQVLLEWAASGNTNLNTKKFATYERDAGTGLDYAMARMYQPQRGRFMQPDPAWLSAVSLARPQSLNRYSYVENDPVNFIDPSGNNPIAYGVLLAFLGAITPRGSVTINASTNAGMMGIPGSTAIVAVEESVDGGVGIVGGGGEQVHYFNPPNWGDYLNELTAQGQCGRFLKDFQGQLGSNYPLDTILGFTTVTMEAAITPDGRTLPGRNFFEEERMEVIITPIENPRARIPGGAPPDDINQAHYQYTTVLVHELLHFNSFGGPNFSHTDFRNAVLGLNDPRFNGIYRELQTKVDAGDIRQSQADTALFEVAFQSACPQP